MARARPPQAAVAAPKAATPPAEKKRAPPTEYSEELGELICERIATQPVSLEKILSEPGMPDRKTFYRWRQENAQLAAKFELAKQLQVEQYVDQTIEIADERASTKEQVMRNKIRIAARQWYAEKLVPKLYGQKVGIGGAEGLPPVDVRHQVDVDVNMTSVEAYRRMLRGDGG